jgi:hypothetical protein
LIELGAWMMAASTTVPVVIRPLALQGQVHRFQHLPAQLVFLQLEKERLIRVSPDVAEAAVQ